MRGGLAALALLIGSGCAHDAILELALELPATADDDRDTAVVDARAGAEPTGEGDSAAVFELGDPEPAALSIVAGPDDQPLPLFIRVRFCRTDRCAAEADPPQLSIRIARAFYAGVRTFLTVPVPEVPAGRAELDVDACAVRGCIAGGAETYCVGDRHVCEL